MSYNHSLTSPPGSNVGMNQSYLFRWVVGKDDFKQMLLRLSPCRVQERRSVHDLHLLRHPSEKIPLGQGLSPTSGTGDPARDDRPLLYVRITWALILVSAHGAVVCLLPWLLYGKERRLPHPGTAPCLHSVLELLVPLLTDYTPSPIFFLR